jgi:hypothetical protein
MKYAVAYCGKIVNNSHNFLPTVKNFTATQLQFHLCNKFHCGIAAISQKNIGAEQLNCSAPYFFNFLPFAPR